MRGEGQGDEGGLAAARVGAQDRGAPVGENAGNFRQTRNQGKARRLRRAEQDFARDIRHDSYSLTISTPERESRV